MGGRRDYSRWDYDDETEITMEEQLTLEEDNGSLGGSAETLSSNATFPPPNVLASSSPIRRRESCKRSRKTSIKEKAQLFVLSSGILLVGFMAGFGIGTVREGESPSASRHSKHFDPMSASSHEHNDLIFHELLQQISGHKIRDNLKTMTKEEHRAGTKEGYEMAIAIQKLWRNFEISVRVEQHKTLLTKTESFNYVEALSENGTVLFSTSKISDDVNLPNSRPIVAFSPPADFNGTLVYGNYGRLEDFQRLQTVLRGSIALVRFGTLHPSTVTAVASNFGIKGLLFYPDPQDFGPNLPATAIRRSSLLTVGQMHDYQKRKGTLTIPSHTISAKDAETLFRSMEGSEKAPTEWEGWLNMSYHTGVGRKPDGLGLVRLKAFNEAKMSSIYNVVAAIPGSIESDRYVIIGCSYDSWAGGGAGDPGIGLAITTELLRAFSLSLEAGWKPRRSLLFISWDANLFAASGVWHWIQEHHFEIATRAVAYIDMTRTLKGNETLEVFSSPLLKEVVRKAINKIKHASTATLPAEKMPPGLQNVLWKSVVSGDEAAFAFMGNLGVPFIRICFSNSPKGYNYPLFHTTFDTFDNFAKLVDSDFRGSETLGRLIGEIILLLADSSALPITLHDYVKDIRKEFDHFTAEYRDDLFKANLSSAQFQAAVSRLEATAKNFRAQTKNHTTTDNAFGSHHRKLRREMQHRIVNDKLISVEKALLTHNSDNDGYKHNVIGLVSSTEFSIPHFLLKPQEVSHLVNKSNTIVVPRRLFSTEQFPGVPHFFPKLRAVLECGRSCDAGLNVGDDCSDSYLFSTISQPWVSLTGESNNNSVLHVSLNSNIPNSSCLDWRNVAAHRMLSLVRSLDSVSAIIQSPLVTQPQE